jgi:hypothetical protein
MTQPNQSELQCSASLKLMVGGADFNLELMPDAQLTPKNMLLRILKEFATEQVAQSEPAV